MPNPFEVAPTLFVIVFVLAFSAAYGALLAAPWVPTRKRLREAVAENFSLPPGSTFVDVGCGDGAVLFAYADRNPGVRAVGYEVSLVPFMLGLVRKWRGGEKYRNVRFRYRNFFKEPLQDADAVFFYLLPKVYSKMAEKFAAELKDDALVLASIWDYKELVAEKTVGKPCDGAVFAYRGRQFRTIQPAA